MKAVINQMIDVSNELERQSRVLSACIERIGQVRSGISSLSGMDGAVRALGKTGERLNEEKDKLVCGSLTLEQIAQLYQQMEQRIVNRSEETSVENRRAVQVGMWNLQQTGIPHMLNEMLS